MKGMRGFDMGMRRVEMGDTRLTPGRLSSVGRAQD